MLTLSNNSTSLGVGSLFLGLFGLQSPKSLSKLLPDLARVFVGEVQATVFTADSARNAAALRRVVGPARLPATAPHRGLRRGPSPLTVTARDRPPAAARPPARIGPCVLSLFQSQWRRRIPTSPDSAYRGATGPISAYG